METEKIDARKISTQAQQEKRDIAMRLRDAGMKNIEVAKIVGVHHCTVSQWYSKYQRDKSLIKIKKRGVQKSTGKKLSDKEEQQIIRLLIDKNPQQLKLKFALWTKESVRQLIYQELNKLLPISTVGEYLRKWQFTSKNQ